MGRLRKVRAESGRLIPFRQSKISESINEAVVACGTGDSILSEELSGVVTLFLEKRFDDDHPPSLQEVRDMIYKVLVETGHVRIANTFRRIQCRSGSMTPSDVRDADAPVIPEDEDLGEEIASGLEVVGGTGGITQPWRRELLLRSVLDETRISESEAEEIAIEVERKLAIAGLGRVTTSLIREFVAVEMASRGHESMVNRYRLLGVSKQEIDRWLYPEDGEVVDPQEMCAQAVLSNYELEEIHTGPVAKAHLAGRIHILGLGHPQKVEDIRFDAAGPLLPSVSRIEEFLVDLVTLLQGLRPLVRQRVVIVNFASVIENSEKKVSAAGMSRFVNQLLDHLTRVDVFGRPVFSPVTLELELKGGSLSGGEQTQAEKLSLLLLDRLESQSSLSGRLGLTFKIHAGSDNAASPWPNSQVLDKLLIAARKHRGVGLELVRHDDQAVDLEPNNPNSVLLGVGAVAINVPYALALADVRNVDEITQALDGPLRLAIDAIFEKYWFLRRSAPETLKGLVARLASGSELAIEGTGQGAQIQLWGLAQGIKFLVGRGIISESEGPSVLARIFSYVEYMAGEEREQIRLEMSLGGVTDRKVRARLLSATDALAMQLGHAELTAALAQSLIGLPSLPLTTPVFGAENEPVLRGTFLRKFGRGLPIPTRGADDIANAEWLRQLFDSTDLAYVELEERAEIFEFQEQLFE